MKKIIAISVVATIILATAVVFVIKMDKDRGDQYKESKSADIGLFSKEKDSSGPVSLDPQKEVSHISKVAGEKSAHWMRGMPLIWNNIENKKGYYDWEEADDMFGGKDGYFSGDVYHIAMIWPYANWDQDACRKDPKYLATGHLKESGEPLKMGAPCDMKAYEHFVEKVVERYDGDGTDDMPGLKTPIKYWEIMNEPEMQGGSVGGAGEDLKFFVGSPQEYLEILKISYKAIKKTDPEAKVAHAGMAGMQQNFQDFWDPVFAGGGGEYFDIANIHSISTDETREDLYVLKFREYLKKHEIAGKPIWVTEVQLGDLMGKPRDVSKFEKLMARSSVFALAKGAEKLFMIENWTQWDNPDAYGPKEENKEKKKKEPEPELDFENSTTHKVYLTLVKMVGSFDRVDVLNEKYTEGKMDHDGATTQIGQYKFISGNRIIYVLWGNGAIPAEITGTVKATDIYGFSQTIDASAIKTSDSPVFVEKQ